MNTIEAPIKATVAALSLIGERGCVHMTSQASQKNKD